MGIFINQSWRCLEKIEFWLLFHSRSPKTRFPRDSIQFTVHLIALIWLVLFDFNPRSVLVPWRILDRGLGVLSRVNTPESLLCMKHFNRFSRRHRQSKWKQISEKRFFLSFYWFFVSIKAQTHCLQPTIHVPYGFWKTSSSFSHKNTFLFFLAISRFMPKEATAREMLKTRYLKSFWVFVNRPANCLKILR